MDALAHDDLDGPLIVASILEPDLGGTLRVLAGVRSECSLIEIRADRLAADAVAAAVRSTTRPVIVTVRGPLPEGEFDGSIEERRRRLLAALDAGARFIDVEFDGPLRDLALGPAAARVILSHHGARCVPAVLGPLWREMATWPAARLKIVPRAERVAELGAVRELLAGSQRDRRLGCFAYGRAGGLSRLLAPSWGSWATYGAARAGCETAPGQFTVDDLLDVHRVLRLGAGTRRAALVGNAVFSSPSPAMHAVVGEDSVLFPVEIDDLEEIDPILEAGSGFGISGLAVTRPFKEHAGRRCGRCDAPAAAAGAVNTVRLSPAGWEGFNTDAPAALALLPRGLHLSGGRVAILGAGGTARAIGSALAGRGARVTLFAREIERARAAAASIGATARDWSERCTFEWELLVQATPLGTRGEDALDGAPFAGRVVLDAVYAHGGSPLVRRARREGLFVVEGIDLLVEQGRRQVGILGGACPTPTAMRAAADRWLAERAQLARRGAP